MLYKIFPLLFLPYTHIFLTRLTHFSWAKSEKCPRNEIRDQQADDRKMLVFSNLMDGNLAKKEIICEVLQFTRIAQNLILFIQAFTIKVRNRYMLWR